MAEPGRRPFFVTDEMASFGYLLAQNDFSFEKDCSPDYRSGTLLLSPRVWVWLRESFPGLEQRGRGCSGVWRVRD